MDAVFVAFNILLQLGPLLVERHILKLETCEREPVVLHLIVYLSPLPIMIPPGSSGLGSVRETVSVLADIIVQTPSDVSLAIVGLFFQAGAS
ncbi:MAG: hypothetical protein ACUVV6_04315 [Thermoplasmatota archaeon]